MEMLLPSDIDEKQGRILTAALSVFAAYGFKRTSMEDIAASAGMSRAALYQHFRNKDDILTTGIRVFFDAVEADLRAALASGATLEEAMRLGCFATAGEMARLMLNSPHGEELLMLKSGAAAELVAEREARIVTVWADWLSEQDAAGRLRLPEGGAMAAAVAIIAGQYGQKATATGYDDYIARLAVYAELMARALAP